MSDRAPSRSEMRAKLKQCERQEISSSRATEDLGITVAAWRKFVLEEYGRQNRIGRSPDSEASDG